MPETEDRSLEDIEVHFSDNQRKITDRKIQKNVSVKSFDIPKDLVATIESERKLKEAAEAELKNVQLNGEIKTEQTRQNYRTDSGFVNGAFISDNN